jgi:uncharacterized protein YjbK
LTQSLEIEFKNLLTQLEYEKIKSYFSLNESMFFHQENHYFDTSNFSLKEKHSALRIRKKGDYFELTLKQPVSEGLLETNQILTETEANGALEHHSLPKGQVTELLTNLNINPDDIHFFGTLTTRRAEWEYKEGLLVLDFSSYLNTNDYELEYEVLNREVGHKTFIDLLSTLQIPLRQTESKIMRFYLQKYKQLTSNSSNNIKEQL